MPVFFVFGVVLAIVTLMWGLTLVMFYGTRDQVTILLAVAWVIVFILWKAGI